MVKNDGEVTYSSDIMKIEAPGFEMTLTPVHRTNGEDWARVNVAASVPGFRGLFDAWIQSSDLVRFADECTQLYKTVGTVGQAHLSSAEPGLELVLTSNQRGHIVGEYRLESERRAGKPTLLTGTFETDQAYLPHLAKSIHKFVEELRVPQ